MGNNIVTYEVNNQVISEDKMSQLKFIRKGHFNHLGEMELHALQDHYLLSKCYANEISDEDSEYKLMHRDRMLLSHPNLIQYFGYSIKNNHSLLRNLIETRWYFEYLHVTLRDVVINHRNYLSNVHEKEIWRLLKQCVSVNAYLESKIMCHSEIQTDQIYLDKDQNVKFIEKGLLRLQSGYARALTKENYTLLSPLLVSQFNQQVVTPSHDINKSDVFSLGMTFLELMTLKDSAQCYVQSEELTIDQSLITQRLAGCLQIYSENLVNVISNMLIWDEDKRPYFRDILLSTDLDDYDRIQVPVSQPKPISRIQQPNFTSPTVTTPQKIAISRIQQEPVIPVTQQAPQPKAPVLSPKQIVLPITPERIISQRVLIPQYQNQIQYSPQQLLQTSQQKYGLQQQVRTEGQIQYSPQQLLQTSQQQYIQQQQMRTQVIQSNLIVTPTQQFIREQHVNWQLAQRVQTALANSKIAIEQYGYE